MPKTTPGPMWSFSKIETSMGSMVSKILNYRQNTLLLHIVGWLKITATKTKKERPMIEIKTEKELEGYKWKLNF